MENLKTEFVQKRYKNGQLKSDTSYAENGKEITRREYDENGQLGIEVTYENGK